MRLNSLLLLCIVVLDLLIKYEWREFSQYKLEAYFRPIQTRYHSQKHCDLEHLSRSICSVKKEVSLYVFRGFSILK